MPEYRFFKADGDPEPPVGGPTVRAAREALTFGDYMPSLTTCGALNDPAIPYTTINGDVNMDATGQILENAIVNGRVRMRGANQIVRNCYIYGGPAPTSGTGNMLLNCENTNCVNALIEDVTIIPSDVSLYWSAAFGGKSFTAKRIYTKNSVDGFYARNVFYSGSNLSPIDVSVLGCWVDGLAKFYPEPFHNNGTHNDCVQMFGGTNWTMTGTILDCTLNSDVGNTGGLDYTSSGVPSSPAKRMGNACIQLNSSTTGPTRMGAFMINKNWLRSGGLTINGLDPNNASSPGTVTIRDNIIDQDQYYAGAEAQIVNGPVVVFLNNQNTARGAAMILARS